MLYHSNVTIDPPTISGKPHQTPSPTNSTMNTGASAVPNPSSAFNPSTARSTAPGKNAAAKVFNAGTVKPNPTPMHVVAASKIA